MSYLSLPRITFSGLFEADVNTVNNDVRNFASEVFEPRFQTRQKSMPDGSTEYNGWWNPRGSNRFSLQGCAATGLVGLDSSSAANDIATRLTLEAQIDRTAAKLVDLDPQFQMASAIWGLRIALVADGVTVLSGTFSPTPFRDLYFGRVLDMASGQPVAGSPGASARFIGVLDELVWDPDITGSAALTALKASADANQGRLSFSLMTYGYSKSGGTADFLTGTVIATLAPWFEGEPELFAPGRRFAPSTSSANFPWASASGFGFTTASVTEDRKRLTVDFGISLPLQLNDASGGDGLIQPQNLGPITVAVAVAGDASTGNPAVAPGVSEGQVLSPDQYQAIGVLSDYDSAAWLQRTGGVIDFDIPEAAAALIADHPLLLLVPTTGQSELTVAIRETIGGLWVRADNFVQRLDTAPTGWVSADISIWAMQWGRPWADAPITLSLPPVTQQGGTGDPKEVKPPQAAIPDNNVPLTKISIPPSVVTGPDGVATVSYWAQDPGNPRGYIDGQLYQIAYAPAVAGASAMPVFEVVVSHVRDAYVPPEVPSWDGDVRPVLAQYSNLYPIMSRGLFSLADFESVAANAKLLHLAFTLPIEDPNYMPATRDMSAGKLRMIVDWLKSFLPPGSPAGYGAIPALPVGAPSPTPPASAAATPMTTAAPAPVAPRPEAIAALGSGNDGKTAAARAFMQNAARNSSGG